MHPVLTLFRKDALLFMRHRGGMIITFLVPIVLIYLFGFVFGLNGRKDFGPSGIPLLIVDQCQSKASHTLVEALSKEKTFKIQKDFAADKQARIPLTEDEARRMIQDNEHRFALIIPEDFVSSESVGIHLIFLKNPRNEIETLTVTGMLQKTIFLNLKDVFSESLAANARRLLGSDKFTTYNRSMAKLIASTFNGDEDQIFQRFESGDYWNLETIPASPSPLPDPSLRSLDAPQKGQAELHPQEQREKRGQAEFSSASKGSDGIVSSNKGSDGIPPQRKESPLATEEPPPPTRAEDLLAKLIRIDDQQVVGKQVKNPTASRLIGGYAIMFLLFAVSGFASSFFDERRSGIFQRLLATRTRRRHILWSKFLFCMALGICQTGVLFIFGDLVYDIDLLSHWLPLLVVVGVSSAACASFGMLIASLADSPQAANGLATMLILTMSAVGGAWFPISFMPEFIQKCAKLTVVYWSVEGFTNVLWADYGVIQSLPGIGILLLITLICQSVALWRFRRRDLIG